MERKNKRSILKDQSGFTLIEIIAVLIILGILAAVAIPKYLGATDQARTQAAQGQVGEAKGRLSQALARHMLTNGGDKPANGADLLTYIMDDLGNASACPAAVDGADIEEGDFTFSCAGATGTTKEVTITVSAVQRKTLDPVVTATYDFAD